MGSVRWTVLSRPSAGRFEVLQLIKVAGPALQLFVVPVPLQASKRKIDEENGPEKRCRTDAESEVPPPPAPDVIADMGDGSEVGAYDTAAYDDDDDGDDDYDDGGIGFSWDPGYSSSSFAGLYAALFGLGGVAVRCRGVNRAGRRCHLSTDSDIPAADPLRYVGCGWPCNCCSACNALRHVQPPRR